MKYRHLPLFIDAKTNRHHYYETLWKVTALDLLKKQEPDLRGMSLLDYGCGRGETMSLAKVLGMDVAGTDMEQKCVDVASVNGKTCLLQIDDPVSQFGENSFDVVACFHVLEHVPCPVKTLSDIGKIARKYVLLAVPNLSVFHSVFSPTNWIYFVNEGHLQSWDHAHFKRLLETHCGFEILSWGFDTVKIPPFSNYIARFLGNKLTIWVETKIFKRIYPFASHSIIAIAKPPSH
jgi:SAM-dependent methyltransferase